ncbi:retrovirus-related pol polyprotein from transposon TNT 1-94 [Tanacetum coccineum]
MHSRFEMSLMGEMKFFLGLQIHQSPKGIFINQAKYALEILKKHNMDNCHSIGTPLATKPKPDVDLSGEPVDQSNYRSKIGSLMYLASSRPDLVQAVCYCARYQARPTQKHLKETLIMPESLDTGKAHLVPWWLTCKLDVKETKLHCNVFSRGRVCGVICKLCSSNVDEDTTSRLWLQLQQNTVVLRLSVSHSNLMQPRTTFANKAHHTRYPYSLKERLKYWYK